MAREAGERRLRHQLGKLLALAGTNPKSWIPGVVVGSIGLALLDTLGVAAMAPLMQLITTGSADSGVLGSISDFFGTSSPQTLIPIVAGIVAGLFILKSVCALVFRWWILGRTTRISALASSQLMRLYILAPYADHRARRTSEIYRSVSDSTAQSTSVLLAVTALFTDGLVLVALAAVIAVVSPTVMVVTAVIFGVLVFGAQRALRNRQSHIGEEVSASALQSWQFLLPALDGFREARLTSSANAFADGYPGGEAAHGSRRASAGDSLGCPAIPARDRIRPCDHRHLRGAVGHDLAGHDAHRSRRLRRGVDPRPAHDEPCSGEPRDDPHGSGRPGHRDEHRRRAARRRHA